MSGFSTPGSSATTFTVSGLTIVSTRGSRSSLMSSRGLTPPDGPPFREGLNLGKYVVTCVAVDVFVICGQCSRLMWVRLMSVAIGDVVAYASLSYEGGRTCRLRHECIDHC